MPKSIVGKMRRAASDALLPLFDANDRAAFTPERKRKLRESDPKFRETDDRFQAEVDAHQKEMMDDERAAAARDLKAKRNKVPLPGGIRG